MIGFVSPRAILISWHWFMSRARALCQSLDFLLFRTGKHVHHHWNHRRTAREVSFLVRLASLCSVQGAGQGGSHETNGTPGVTHGNPLQSGRTIKDYQNQKRWPFLENEECETWTAYSSWYIHILNIYIYVNYIHISCILYIIYIYTYCILHMSFVIWSGNNV